jgi:hypothetical protein
MYLHSGLQGEDGERYFGAGADVDQGDHERPVVIYIWQQNSKKASHWCPRGW